MLHTILITVHVAGGLVALVSGLLVLNPADATPMGFRLYLASLWTMALALAAAMALGVPALDPPTRITFGALTLFAGYVGWRGWSARRDLRGRRKGWRRRYTADIGFTLIALVTGFIVVAVLDLGAPVWLVLATGLLAILGGRAGLGQAERRLTA